MTKRGLFQLLLALAIAIVFACWAGVVEKIGAMPAMVLIGGLFLTFAFEVRFAIRARLWPDLYEKE
ncbi:MAG: hypothetical protein JNL35_16560 [Sphingopyxis sp.]|nr:hypothetical protein [Sphingopyxis sp.]